MRPLTERVTELEREMAEIYDAEYACFVRGKTRFWRDQQHEKRQERLEEIQKELAAWLRRPAG